MKILKYLVILIFFTPCCATSQTPKAIKAELSKYFKRIGYWEQHRYDENVTGDDSLLEANDNFQQRLKIYAVKYPFTLNQNFSAIKHLVVCTADDKNLRSYSWDDGLGGTLRFYRNTIQFSEKGKLYSVNVETGLITAIYMLKTNHQKYYLITDFGQAMTGYNSEGVQIWSVRNGHLVRDNRLIKTESGYKNSISYAYYWTNDPSDGFLSYNKELKMLDFPGYYQG